MAPANDANNRATKAAGSDSGDADLAQVSLLYYYPCPILMLAIAFGVDVRHLSGMAMQNLPSCQTWEW